MGGGPILVGTVKGAVILRFNSNADEWHIGSPIFKGWKVTAACAGHDAESLVATSSTVYGPAIHASTDLEHWQQVEQGPSYQADRQRKLDQIWRIVRAPMGYYAGVSGVTGG